MERTQQNRRDLFERLAKEHEGALMRVALRMCSGNRDRAADCVQETILNGYRAFMAGKLDDVSGFRPWMFRILTNEVYADQRRHSRTTTSEDIDQLVESSQAKDSPTERDVLSGILDSDLEMALRSLSDEQRMTVLLVDVEEMDYAEAAEVLQVPIGTVRSRLARARLKMFELLSERRGANA